MTKLRRGSKDICRRLKNLASYSDVRSKHACVIVNRKTGKIVADGFNYHYHKSLTTSNNSEWVKEGNWSMHAEEAAYRKFLKYLKRNKVKSTDNFDLIVIRIRLNGESGFKNSRPCCKCQTKLKKLLNKSIIDKVYYSTDSESDDLNDVIIEEVHLH